MVDKRAAKTAYRERAPDWAVVAVRIGDGVWLKLTPDPDALGNRLGFTLRTGGGRGLAPGMAQAYAAQQSVVFDVLERLDPKLSEMARARVGEARLAYWADTLGATPF